MSTRFDYHQTCPTRPPPSSHQGFTLMRWLSRPSRARVRKSRLAVNTLETRVTPAKVPVLTVDAGHSFVSQLAVAQPGAVLQVEPGATIGNLGTTAGLVQNANPGDTTIQ